MSPTIKKFAIVAVILIALAVAYKFLSGGTKAPAGPLSTTATDVIIPGSDASSGALPNNSDFAALLSSIKLITIDTSLFNNPTYKSLRDFPVNLGTDVVGRQNPFAPLGSDAGAPAGGGVLTTDPTVNMIQPSKVTGTTAEFAAQVTVPDLTRLNVVFQYGTSDILNNVTAPISIAKTGTALVPVTNLTPDTTYYVQAVAVRGSSSFSSNIMSFTTAKK